MNFLYNTIDPWAVLFGLGVLILIFILLRELVCWYWKINRVVELLEDIKENTTPQASQRVIEVSEEKEVDQENEAK